MTVREALENALALLESQGFTSGDVHDDLKLAYCELCGTQKNVTKLANESHICAPCRDALASANSHDDIMERRLSLALYDAAHEIRNARYAVSAVTPGLRNTQTTDAIVDIIRRKLEDYKII
jgi:hypothetical protein